MIQLLSSNLCCTTFTIHKLSCLHAQIGTEKKVCLCVRVCVRVCSFLCVCFCVLCACGGACWGWNGTGLGLGLAWVK
jgi:hypothetical protein